MVSETFAPPPPRLGMLGTKSQLGVHEGAYLVVVTRGHRDDMRVLRLALGTPARYIAMVGSKRKVIAVVKELEKEGIMLGATERLHAPMGLDIAVRRGAASAWRQLSKSLFAGELPKVLAP